MTPERERLVRAVETTPHRGHPTGWWAQGCPGCAADVALASHDQPSFYAHGQADLAHPEEAK